MKRTDLLRVLAAAMLAAVCLAPTSAFATTECTSDADCADGFTCEEHQEPCPAVDCIDGQDCSNNCEPSTVSECTPEPPASCDSAADCAADEVCVTYESETCSATAQACASGQECDAGAAPDAECTTETIGYCLPPYLAPCQTDSDCGAGFACVEAESCACSGSSGGSTGVGSGGTGAPEVVDAGMADAGSSEDDCSCTGSGTYYCELQEQECTNDTDCAGDLICDTLPWGEASGSVSTCTATPDGGTSCEDAGTSTTNDTKYCQPDDLERWAAAGGTAGGTSSDPQSNSGGSYQAGDDKEVSSVDRGNGAAGGNGGSGSSESAGCASTGTSVPVSGAFAALLFGVIGFVRRRRRR